LAAAAPNRVVREVGVWNGAAQLVHIVFDTKSFFSELPVTLKEALRVRQSRLENKSVDALIAALRSRGIDIEKEKPDRNDVVGLIGEIITAKYSERDGCRIVYAKWKVGGTSKSKGLDLISAFGEGAAATFTVLEAKHLPGAVALPLFFLF
jgi:hypothetical protein